MFNADGAAAVESLRAELAQAKEQARRSDAAASRATEELEAERAAHCRSREEMAGMDVKLKDATDRYEVLERERRVEQEDLKKAGAEAKDARSAMRAIKEELRQAGDIAAGKPFLLRRKFVDPKICLVGPVVECGGCLSRPGGKCRGRGRTLPRSKGSRDGKGFLVAVP